jgi:hypothetical protein
LIEAGVDLEGKNESGQTPVLCAVDNRKVEVFEMLVLAKVNLEATDKVHLDTTAPCMVLSIYTTWQMST